VVISQALVDEIVAHARDGFPNEVCGLVATEGGQAIRVYPIDSLDPSPVQYHMDPKQQLRAITEIDDNEWEMGGIYHSHTRTRAYPSATDVKLAFYPSSLYMIVSLADESNPELRAFRIEDAQIEEVSLDVV
jgi:[CysO sulfur-carrier protein]-S-L-cysteine hydrolase